MNTELNTVMLGDWRVDKSGYLTKGGGLCIMNGNECVAVVGDGNTHQPINAHAQLIADAGNTIQSCGLLPSQLLKQNNEMREKLQFFLDSKGEILRALDFANELADDYAFLFEGLETLINSNK